VIPIRRSSEKHWLVYCQSDAPESSYTDDNEPVPARANRQGTLNRKLKHVLFVHSYEHRFQLLLLSAVRGVDPLIYLAG
jgi:hypothetical protein